ncbi:hypothetical protein ANCDUO_01961 [Ancylostoma duodenale]|uniref:Uncharacterized protein n=1 Tax=Ancylostoma duodenale TaxID=51022 RepID=A0A0C2DXL5_9BILA|nr:hypothetical protein ANCDUO_01961 [Ancylostoma duodenale]
MTRIDPYSASIREEQKAILNGLLAGCSHQNKHYQRFPAQSQPISKSAGSWMNLSDSAASFTCMTVADL